MGNYQQCSICPRRQEKIWVVEGRLLCDACLKEYKDTGKMPRNIRPGAKDKIKKIEERLKELQERAKDTFKGS